MNTSPSNDDLLEGVILALQDEIVPHLANPKALATIQMMQSLLQGIRQTLPIVDSYLVDEHNDMITTMSDAAEALGDVDGPAADRIRERAATHGQRDPLPAPPDPIELLSAHRDLTKALESTFRDLDELQRSDVPVADEAIRVIRAHLAPRYIRQVEAFTVGDGFVGRG